MVSNINFIIRPRIVGLGDLKKDEDNSLYAGGEKSGMAIEGDDRQHNLIRNILEKAKK